jgi:hypothetical protein
MQASRICESFADNGLTSVDFGVVIRFSFRAHKLPPEQQEFNLSRSCPRAKRFGAADISSDELQPASSYRLPATL